MAVSAERAGRAAATLAVAGAVVLAMGLISTVHAGVAHLEARDRWLVHASRRDHPAYDARTSDAHYDRAAGALDEVRTWARFAGAGLLVLAVSFALRRRATGPAPGPRGRLLLRLALAALLGAATWLALRHLGAGIDDPRAGPIAETVTSALAPFLGAGAALFAFGAISRRGG